MEFHFNFLMAAKLLELYDNRILIQSVTPDYEYTGHPQGVMGSKSMAKNQEKC
jgi:hypothetical protein